MCTYSNIFLSFIPHRAENDTHRHRHISASFAYTVHPPSLVSCTQSNQQTKEKKKYSKPLISQLIMYHHSNVSLQYPRKNNVVTGDESRKNPPTNQE